MERYPNRGDLQTAALVTTDGTVDGFRTPRSGYQQDRADPADWPNSSRPSRPDLAEPTPAALASIVAEMEETARMQKETAKLLCEMARTQSQAASQWLSKAQDLRQRLGAMQINLPAQRGPANSSAQRGLGDRQRRRSASVGQRGKPEGSLTAQEQAVLRLLATSLSLREISQHMHLSRDTVKSHTRAVYRKLGATSRGDALQRGHELAILPSTRKLVKLIGTDCR